jgi:hypothetical protein
MRQFINGREYDIPTNPDGSINSNTLRKASGIPSNRALIMQNPDGSNRMVNPGQNLNVRPGQHYSDMFLHKRG